MFWTRGPYKQQHCCVFRAIDCWVGLCLKGSALPQAVSPVHNLPSICSTSLHFTSVLFPLKIFWLSMQPLKNVQKCFGQETAAWPFAYLCLYIWTLIVCFCLFPNKVPDDLTPEEKQELENIRRRKQELLEDIQVISSNNFSEISTFLPQKSFKSKASVAGFSVSALWTDGCLIMLINITKSTLCPSTPLLLALVTAAGVRWICRE